MPHEQEASIYESDYRNKPKQKVENTQPGDYVQTPNTNPENFIPKGKNKQNENTGELWQKDYSEHYGEGWKVGIGKGEAPTKNNKVTVDKDGKVIKKDN